MFRGSPELSAAQLADITATMGGKFNADTQQTVTQYFFTVPGGSTLAIPLRVEATRMSGLLASEALWKQEAGGHMSRKWPRTCPTRNASFIARLLAAMFKGTPWCP